MTFCSYFSEQQQEEDAMHRESGLGLLDFQACLDANKTATRQKRNSYQKWTEVERYEIGKYASIYGHANDCAEVPNRIETVEWKYRAEVFKLYQEEIEND